MSPERGAASAPGGAEPDGVRRMFDGIAPRYDLLNRVLSLRRDVRWRREVARRLPAGDGLRVLDLATGTADQLLALLSIPGKVSEAVGLDVAENMLAIGREKVRRLAPGIPVRLAPGDATAIPLPDASFDAVTIAFGIRNVGDVPRALREMRRVLKPGGRALVLEFSTPRSRVIRAAYLFYLRHVLPRVGGWISGDADAYRYLNRTIEAFPSGEAFCRLMREAGFEDAAAHPLTLGIVTVYQACSGKEIRP